MFLNHILHIVVGALASTILPWSVAGVFTAIFISAGVQGIDTFRIRRQIIAMTMGNPEPVRSQQLAAIGGAIGTYKLVQLFIFKTLWYSLVTLGAAHLARTWAS